MTDLGSSLDRTEAFIRGEGYRGYDPYDGLASPLFRLPWLNRAHLPRWGFQQVLKRLPFQTRPLLGIPKGYNPVTLGLCAQALTWRDMAAGDGHDSRRDEVEKLIAELDRMRTPGYSGSCWGYDFHWQARYANFPAGHPTVVATGFITHALFTVWHHYRIERARELILDAAKFVLNDLHRTVHGDTFCWSYSPSDRQEVLNATMKGARLVARSSLGGDRSWLEDASATIRYVVSRQSDTGSWPYSIGDTRSWADHFHTCYNLDCMHEYQVLSGDDAFAQPLTRGLEYYTAHFFTDEGVPKYYDQSVYPIDATCCGQSLLTLLRFDRHEQAGKTARWILDRMALPDGAFKYQIHPKYENRLVYMRWSVAWIFAGLARLELATARQGR